MVCYPLLNPIGDYPCNEYAESPNSVPVCILGTHESESCNCTTTICKEILFLKSFAHDLHMVEDLFRLRS